LLTLCKKLVSEYEVRIAELVRNAPAAIKAGQASSCGSMCCNSQPTYALPAVVLTG
jgi:hypothetical protein